MKTNDFEDQLKRQPFRRVPDDWRAEILRSAKADSSSDVVEQVSPDAPRWREWLWPCPQAWAGLAAVWIMILLMNSTDDHLAGVARAKPAEHSSELATALREQRRLLAELIEPPPTAHPARSFVPRRRSDRTREEIAV